MDWSTTPYTQNKKERNELLEEGGFSGQGQKERISSRNQHIISQELGPYSVSLAHPQSFMNPTALRLGVLTTTTTTQNNLHLNQEVEEISQVYYKPQSLSENSL